MTNNLIFSLRDRGAAEQAFITQALERFSGRITPLYYPWSDAWSKMRQIVFERSGSHAAEIGTTFVGSLMAMDGLRPFQPAEVAMLGGVGAFSPAVWTASSMMDDRRVLSIPALADTRIICYWGDLLEQAGIDESTAFASPAHLTETCEKLRAAGCETPWCEITYQESRILHHAASWIRGAGGDLVSTDGRRTRFAEPPALAGLRAYFDLHRFMPPDAVIDDELILRWFFERRIAAFITGPWAMSWIQTRGFKQDQRLRLALPPGPAFVGGRCLIIWSHVAPRDERLLLELVACLTQPDTQRAYVAAESMLPVRADLLGQPPYSDDRHYQVFSRALQTGQPLPNFARWGIIEERLIEALGQTWSDLRAAPQTPLDELLARRFKPLAARLDRTLAL